MVDKTSEKYIDKKLGEEVKKLGGLSIKIVAPNFIGIPDRLIILPNMPMFFVEVKTTGKKPSPIQKVVIAKLQKLGQRVYVLDSIENIKSILSWV
jgi:hypothetical protein